jgi:RNA polymerase sigma-70 factor (sigma-E family)
MRRSERDEAFTEYVAARRAQLRRTAYLICGDWHAAEDLVQTALTKLYAAWPRVSRREAIEAYARRIIVRAHVDEGRRPWRRETPGVDGFDQAADEGIEYDDRDALVRALATLPLQQRRAVVLRHWYGLSVRETANDLSCSEGTVKSHTARGMAALRSMLSNDHHSELRGSR